MTKFQKLATARNFDLKQKSNIIKESQIARKSQNVKINKMHKSKTAQ